MKIMCDCCYCVGERGGYCLDSVDAILYSAFMFVVPTGIIKQQYCNHMQNTPHETAEQAVEHMGSASDLFHDIPRGESDVRLARKAISVKRGIGDLVKNGTYCNPHICIIVYCQV